MIRLAYFEHPDYVALLRRAYENWEQIQSESNESLLQITGGLYMGDPEGEVVRGSRLAAERHDLSHEMLDHGQIADRFPQFRLPSDMVGLFENQAGFLHASRAVAAFARQSQAHGAELHTNEPLVDWQAANGGVDVQTAENKYSCDRIVFCGGAWSSMLLRNLGLKLKVTRQVLGWVKPRETEPFALGRLPVWAIDRGTPGRPAGLNYGFPMDPEEPGLKVALHLPADATDPDAVDKTISPEDEQTFRPVLREMIPQADGPVAHACTCLYTCSPDSHFILDRHPTYPRAIMACGFSGHGFKFASVVGEALADLAVNDHTDLPVGFLGLKRFRV